MVVRRDLCFTAVSGSIMIDGSKQGVGCTVGRYSRTCTTMKPCGLQDALLVGFGTSSVPQAWQRLCHFRVITESWLTDRLHEWFNRYLIDQLRSIDHSYRPRIDL